VIVARRGVHFLRRRWSLESTALSVTPVPGGLRRRFCPGSPATPHGDRDEARRGPLVELLLDLDNGRARGGALLQGAIGAREPGLDHDRVEHLGAAPVQPAT
jgi:hypothetical protein